MNIIFKKLYIFIKRFLLFFGISKNSLGIYSVTKNRSLKSCYIHLKSLNFYPKTIIDVGVASGTPELSKTFPKAYFYLIEPLKQFHPINKKFLEVHRGQLIKSAAGNSSGHVEINVHDDHLEGSSILSEEMGQKADGHKELIEIIKLDSLFKNSKPKVPLLLKVDVQGSELEVLKGFKNNIKHADVIVLEASTFKFMKGSPEIYEIMDFMKKNGYVVYDIVIGWYRPLDNALGQVDLFFVKENGMFRQSHNYSD